MEVPTKLKIDLLYDQVVLLLGIYLREISKQNLHVGQSTLVPVTA